MTEQKQIDEMAKELCHAPTCEVKKNGGTCYKYCNAYIYAFRAINACYRKQREARWKGAGLGDYYCSICNATYSGGNEYNFCPNCGAKMRK